MPPAPEPDDPRSAPTRPPVRIDPSAPRDVGGSRVVELDALRGLAALAVVVFHADGRLIPWGWAAVDLFFVLSGYLIAATVLRHAGGRGFLPRFYVRRGLRLWPLYFLTVGLVAAATPLLKYKPDWSGLPYTLTFTQALPKYWGALTPIFSVYLLHTWTLAIEEQFYLIWPALLLVVGRSRIVPLALVSGAASVAARWSGWDFTLLIGRADGMALGTLLAGLLAAAGADATKRDRIGRVSLAAFLSGFAAVKLLGGFVRLSALTRPGPTVLAYNVMFLGAVGLATLGSGRPALAWLRAAWLVWLGRVSYGLYLIHPVLFAVVGDIAHHYGVRGRPRWLYLPTVGVSMILAGLSYRFIEAPILGWKERFRYSGVAPRIGRRSAKLRSPASSPGP